MSRYLKVAAAQSGPIHKADSRASVVKRLIEMLREAHAGGAKLVVFTELALTTFFPRWWMEASDPELLGCFEATMPNPAVQPLFDRARQLGVGFYLGYAELTPEGQRFNTAITVGPDGGILGKYRKVHLPGSNDFRPGQEYQQLEKRYFAYGDLGFPAFRGPGVWNAPVLGMLICNDRRWPEAWRVLGLQGVELLMVGYNSAAYDPNGGTAEDAAVRTFHSTLVAQANAYMNATWAIAVAKAGVEDGAGLIGGSCIVDPNGKVVVQAKTLDDELIVADLDFEICQQGKQKMFNFAAHRRPQWYGPIAAQTGVVPPPGLPQPG